MLKKIVAILALALGFTLLAAPAYAEDPTPLKWSDCKNLDGWYVNDDERDAEPTPTLLGLLFEGKDLIHHKAVNPLALADVKGGTFVATKPGKVVFKMETDNPYSTIIQNDDGKFWSSRIAVDAPGGQNKPVELVTEMIGSETKTGNPKYTNDTIVTTFGVGYWVADGDTVVSSIRFHGKNYDLKCEPEPEPEPEPTKTATPTPTKTTSPTATATATSSPKPTKTSSAPVAGGEGGSNTDGGEGLPVTGAPIGLLAGGGAVFLGLGAAALFASRRRKASFTA